MNRGIPDQENRKVTRLRLLSYNIQVGITATRYRDYLIHIWKYLLPYARRTSNLRMIAGMISGFDMVGLLELDSGSLRSGFVNHAEFLAKEARFPHWYEKINRQWGRVACHSMGLLTRYPPNEISRHNLPALVPGRGALKVCFGNQDDPLVLVLAHLSLSRNARLAQMEFVSGLIKGYNHVVIMGDLNCGYSSRELSLLLREANLCMPYANLSTYPSWNPRKHLDHILVSPTIGIESVSVPSYPYSDHLPIAMEISVPENVFLPLGGTYSKARAA
ncbi:MAG TPA: endonuclease/exonuclease/phosphatase family protein [Deltaproteobacteria bacterium]|jgi:endonuclease/exonuclease/phosphatase family metal-dependent hydrolase|nr:endonuclease/exonuclease/phosphatase family protein [Deltaproteobacteria bacterium]HOI06622.1 endonuclease/exonuclease/phosphatase family protein [Deltaproteobacteria bacterium]